MSKLLAPAWGLWAACLLVGCGDDVAKLRPARIPARPAVRAIEITPTGLVVTARAAADYLVRFQNEDGAFQYLYDAATDEVINEDYNIVRHAGTAFSLFEMYGATRERQYLVAANRAVHFLKTRFRPAKEADALYVLDFDGKAKLGANGLALLALSRQLALDPASGDRMAALQLANHILAMQEPDGAFLSFHRLRGDEPQGDTSLYYPGEAILGLAEFCKLNPEEKQLLEAAQRGADYLVQSQGEMHELPPDAWLIQALEALNRLKPEPRYVEHGIAIAQRMLRDQYTSEQTPERPKDHNNVGGFGPGEPRAASAAARSEGILAACRMAQAIGDERAVTLLAGLKASARFQLLHQFTKDDTGWLPAADKAAGGFRGSLSSTRVRIDYVQHNVSALLGLAALWDQSVARR